MFQNFDDPASGAAGAKRLAALRRMLKDLNLTGFLVPRADEHQGEYVPPSAERLAWLTGFTGSAGFAVVLAEMAAIFVDGRYTCRCATRWTRRRLRRSIWLKRRRINGCAISLKTGDRIGYDPWLHTVAGVRRLRKACDDAGAILVAVKANPLDVVWNDRPAPPIGPVTRQPDDLAGEATDKKLDRIRKAIATGGADIAVLTQPDSICMAVQYSRLRCRSYAASAILRDGAVRRPADLVHRWPQTRQHDARLSGGTRHGPLFRNALSRNWRQTAGRAAGPDRCRLDSRCDTRGGRERRWHRDRRQRSGGASQGYQERRGACRCSSRRISGTGRRSRAFCTGSTAMGPRGQSTRSARRSSWRRSAPRPVN